MDHKYTFYVTLPEGMPSDSVAMNLAVKALTDAHFTVHVYHDEYAANRRLTDEEIVQSLIGNG